MIYMPKCVFHVITEYAWNQKIDIGELEHNLEKVLTIRDSIPDLFLAPCVWETILQTHVPNPYCSFFPYTPTTHVNQHSIFNNLLLCLGYSIDKEYFDRVRSYRQVFIRYTRSVSAGCFHSWNLLLDRYWASLCPIDLGMNPESKDIILEALALSFPVPSEFLF
jgi:hypothetical protein